MGRGNPKARRNDKARPSRQAPTHQPTSSSRSKTLIQAALIVGLLALIGGMAWVSMRSPKPTVATGNIRPTVPVIPAASAMPLHTDFAIEPKTLNELLDLPVEQLDQVDIARMNLLCATGLPGAEKLDTPGINHALATLDRWAERVRFETDRHIYKFRQNPADYGNSEGYFRMLMLVTVLQQDLGVHYNMDRVRDVDFRRSQDLFLHGMIGTDNGGTCVSMPVIYTAVARRLGYPVDLVLTKTHVFCRWDSPTDRFNIEATNQGMNSFSDEYYLSWPQKISEAEARRNRYLISLSPAESLANFLASRGHCLLDNGRTQAAFDAYAAAHRLAPQDPSYLAWARDAQRRLHPPTFARQGFREPPMVYHNDPMADIERINAINRANMQRTQPPMPGAAQPVMPPRPNLGLPPGYQPQQMPGQPTTP